MPCLAAWHYEILTARAHGRDLGQLKVAGCAVGSDGRIACDPDKMRAAVEARLVASGLWRGPLTLAEYALARNLMSEAGRDATPQEMVALGEVAVNRGWPEVTRFLLRDGRYFARQSGSNPAAASSQDPYLEHVVAAHLILTGRTGRFIGGATHYFSPTAQNGLHRECLAAGGTEDDCTKSAEAVLTSWTTGGGLWVGPRPGIDPRYQLFIDASPAAKANYKTPQGRAVWQAQLAAARAAMTSRGPDQRPMVYQLPGCTGAGPDSSTVRSTVALVSAVMGTVGLTLAAAYYARIWRLKTPPALRARV